MPSLATLQKALERLLEGIVMVLMLAMVLIVVAAVIYRKAGASLVWYDEIASILLAWLTYYGAALAALKRAHIGFPGLVDAMPPHFRLAAVVIAEVFVFGFFIMLGWFGYVVLGVLEFDTLVSLPNVSTQYTQSVIPIGAALFVLAEALSLPAVVREARGLPRELDVAAEQEAGR